MASRGSKAKNGHVTTFEYSTISINNLGIKILKGNGSNHSLPDFSHTPNSVYAKIREDGSLHEMRIYNENCYPVIEIACHPEPKINNGNREPIVHYHSYNGLNRECAHKITQDIKQKYCQYLKEYDLYDKC